MSLINDALKKAQKQRTDEPGASPPRPAPATVPIAIGKPASLPPPPPPALPRPSSIRYNAGPDATPREKKPQHDNHASLKPLWITLGVIAIAAVSVRVTVMIVRTADDPTQAKPAQITKTTKPPAETPRAATPPPTPAAIIIAAPAPPPAVLTPAPVPVAETKPAPALAPVTIPVITEPPAAAPAPIPAPAPVPVVTTKPAPAPALPPLYTPRPPASVNPSARIQSFIDRLRVSGIRLSDSGNKVILNDRLFTAGETVDGVLELKLVKIEYGVLTFTDASEKNYLKLFQ